MCSNNMLIIDDDKHVFGSSLFDELHFEHDCALMEVMLTWIL